MYLLVWYKATVIRSLINLKIKFEQISVQILDYVFANNFLMILFINLLIVIFEILFIQFLKRPYVFIGFSGTVFNDSDLSLIICITILMFLTLSIFLKLTMSIVDSFNPSNSIGGWIKKIAKTYLVIILIFASLYLFISVNLELLNDYAGLKIYYETVEGTNTEYDSYNNEIEKLNNYITYFNNNNINSFNGYLDNIWSVSGNNLDNITIKINIPNYFRGYFQMLYFSCITISTVGYGDISPNIIIIKLLIVFEILLGQFVLIVAIGNAFSSSNNKKHKIIYKRTKYKKRKYLRKP